MAYYYEKNWFKTDKFRNQFELIRVLYRIGLEDEDVIFVFRNMELYNINDLIQLS